MISCKKQQNEISAIKTDDQLNTAVDKITEENKSNTLKDDIEKQSYITFIEIGSVNCIPCKMMQPVMKKIETNYNDQVKVVFYDVWTKEQAHYANIYKIRVIPTQVFLDKEGKEYFRHEGFFPYEEVEKILKIKL
ncbi:MAG: thioredoxin family protein [Spirochaetes bacterium]|nr:thioredoxin family protein [Spirochaetota bacterium]